MPQERSEIFKDKLNPHVGENKVILLQLLQRSSSQNHAAFCSDSAGRAVPAAPPRSLADFWVDCVRRAALLILKLVDLKASQDLRADI